MFLKNNNIFAASDTTFHLRRIMELKDSVNNNKLLPNFSFNRAHGSIIMAMYPYLNLFPLIILSIFIKSKISLIYSFFIFNTFSSFIISYYSSKSYIKISYTAYIFSIVYSLSNNFLAYNFTNMDLGLVSSYIFLPISIFGFLKLINGENKVSWIMLALGMSLISFSHILSLIIVTFFLLIWLLININSLNKLLIINLFKSIWLFFLTSSIVLLPFLALYLFNSHNLIFPEPVQLNNIDIKTFLSGFYGAKKIGSIGFFPLITLPMFIFYYKKFNKFGKQMYYISILTIILALFFPWSITKYKFLNFLNQLQYTYRFFIIPQILLSFIFALIISKYIKSINKKYILFIFTIIVSLMFQLMGQYKYIHNNINTLSVNKQIKKNNNINLLSYKITNQSEFYKIVNSEDNNTTTDYIPKMAFPIVNYVNQNLGFYNNHHEIKINRIGYNTFIFSGKSDIHKLSLPIYKYNKEKIYVYLNNKPVNGYANKNCLLTIDNIKNSIKSNNKIYIRPASDPFRIIGTILSIFGWIFSLGIIIKEKFVR